MTCTSEFVDLLPESPTAIVALSDFAGRAEFQPNRIDRSGYSGTITMVRDMRITRKVVQYVQRPASPNR